jgi:hypothetical protein
MDIQNIYNQELLKLKASKNERWDLLERLHIIGQFNIKLHYHSHWLMFNEAINDKNLRECFGQLMRLFLVLPGHLFRRLPEGNVGTSRVSAFVPMAVPEDLKKLMKK